MSEIPWLDGTTSLCRDTLRSGFASATRFAESGRAGAAGTTAAQSSAKAKREGGRTPSDTASFTTNDH